jgi:transposase InsO family protein
MQSLVSADFFMVPTITFRLLFVFVILSHDRRRPIHLAVTANPTAEWMTRQLLAAFPWDRAPRYLLRDRDACYGKEFHDATGWLGIREVLTAPRSPWQNPFVERLIGTIRRECLDHVIVLHEPGLRRVLKSYFEYYERTRTHCLSIRMLRSLGVYNLRSSERWWSFRRSADSITDMNAGQPSLPGAVLFYN